MYLRAVIVEPLNFQGPSSIHHHNIILLFLKINWRSSFKCINEILLLIDN